MTLLTTHYSLLTTQPLALHANGYSTSTGFFICFPLFSKFREVMIISFVNAKKEGIEEREINKSSAGRKDKLKIAIYYVRTNQTATCETFAQIGTP